MLSLVPMSCSFHSVGKAELASAADEWNKNEEQMCNDNDSRKFWDKNMSQWHLIHHKFHMGWLWVEPGHQRLHYSDWQTHPRQGPTTALYPQSVLQVGQYDPHRPATCCLFAYVTLLTTERTDLLCGSYSFVCVLRDAEFHSEIIFCDPITHTHKLTQVTNALRLSRTKFRAMTATLLNICLLRRYAV